MGLRLVVEKKPVCMSSKESLRQWSGVYRIREDVMLSFRPHSSKTMVAKEVVTETQSQRPPRSTARQMPRASVRHSPEELPASLRHSVPEWDHCRVYILSYPILSDAPATHHSLALSPQVSLPIRRAHLTCSTPGHGIDQGKLKDSRLPDSGPICGDVPAARALPCAASPAPSLSYFRTSRKA